MNAEKLKSLQIDQNRKVRPKGMLWAIFIVVAALTLVAAYLARPKASDSVRMLKGSEKSAGALAAPVPSEPSTVVADENRVLTVSGYIINRERIELSPRFMGVVNWIGVKKGDAVTNGQVVVLLDDTEYRARLLQAESAVAVAQANLAKAEIAFARVNQLAKTDIESKQAQDDARLAVEAAQAGVREAEGLRQLAQAFVEWCVIRSPIDGVVLEKLVDPNELVTPQSFGGTRGPSTALMAVADPKDLQVEIDLNEADLSKVFLNQKCRVSPEAYLDHVYEGYVAEIAPEANRAKGTLQVKVQIREPDHYLTPELSAKVEFLRP